LAQTHESIYLFIISSLVVSSVFLPVSLQIVLQESKLHCHIQVQPKVLLTVLVKTLHNYCLIY